MAASERERAKSRHHRGEDVFAKGFGKEVGELLGGRTEANHDVPSLDGVQTKAEGDAHVTHAAGDDAASKR